MNTTSETKSIITRGQIRAGRALLGWSQEELSRQSGVSANTVKRIEKGNGPIAARFQSIERLVDAFARSGLRFQNDETTISVTLER